MLSTCHQVTILSYIIIGTAVGGQKVVKITNQMQRPTNDYGSFAMADNGLVQILKQLYVGPLQARSIPTSMGRHPLQYDCESDEENSQ
jgi:hypothetical protein